MERTSTVDELGLVYRGQAGTVLSGIEVKHPVTR